MTVKALTFTFTCSHSPGLFLAPMPSSSSSSSLSSSLWNKAATCRLATWTVMVGDCTRLRAPRKGLLRPDRGGGGVRGLVAVGGVEGEGCCWIGAGSAFACGAAPSDWLDTSLAVVDPPASGAPTWSLPTSERLNSVAVGSSPCPLVRMGCNVALRLLFLGDGVLGSDTSPAMICERVAL